VAAARRAGKRTIGVSLENLQEHGRFHALARRMQLVDLLISYELDAHVPRPYFEPGYWEPDPAYGELVGGGGAALLAHARADSAAARSTPTARPRGLKPIKSKRDDPAIAAFISNCEHQADPLARLDVLAALSRYVPVHHYGKCGHNTELPTTRSSPDWGARKLSVVAKYRFVAAMENSEALDYASEKIYHALLVGTIPIYLGAPNIYDLLPCDRGEPCIIHLAEYVDARGELDVARLGAHLVHLAANETAYRQYLRWRERPAPQRFVDLAEIGRHAASCRACHCLRGRLGCAGAVGSGAGGDAPDAVGGVAVGIGGAHRRRLRREQGREPMLGRREGLDRVTSPAAGRVR
jgi:hypothetical protein